MYHEFYRIRNNIVSQSVHEDKLRTPNVGLCSVPTNQHLLNITYRQRSVSYLIRIEGALQITNVSMHTYACIVSVSDRWRCSRTTRQRHDAMLIMAITKNSIWAWILTRTATATVRLLRCWWTSRNSCFWTCRRRTEHVCGQSWPMKLLLVYCYRGHEFTAISPSSHVLLRVRLTSCFL